MRFREKEAIPLDLHSNQYKLLRYCLGDSGVQRVIKQVGIFIALKADKIGLLGTLARLFHNSDICHVDAKTRIAVKRTISKDVSMFKRA